MPEGSVSRWGGLPVLLTSCRIQLLLSPFQVASIPPPQGRKLLRGLRTDHGESTHVGDFLKDLGSSGFW
jgi:hypothetical protein